MRQNRKFKNFKFVLVNTLPYGQIGTLPAQADSLPPPLPIVDLLCGGGRKARVQSHGETHFGKKRSRAGSITAGPVPLKSLLGKVRG